MVLLADVLRRHGPAYLARHGARILPSHRRAIAAITTCRTGALGGHIATCNQCGREHLLYHSCHHRACPTCGHAATAHWLARQQQALLPVPYFHVVFTLPEELRELVRRHQVALFTILFRAAFDALSALCANPRYLGARIGALAVLHTWSRKLDWHPHVHMLVPGGGLAPDGRTWCTPRRGFLVPIRALGRGFRGRFMRLARRALPSIAFPSAVWTKPWIVYAKPTLAGHTEQLLEYLGRYVHRTAITDKRILEVDDKTITFAYRRSSDGLRKVMTLPADEFLRRFLQHVPLRGLHRVRSFGLLHPSSHVLLRRLQILLGATPSADADEPRRPPPLRCPDCEGGVLVLRRRLSPAECFAWSAPALTPPFPSARAPPPVGARP